MYTGLVHIGTSKRLDLKSHSIGLSAMRLPRPDKIFNPNRAGRADIPSSARRGMSKIQLQGELHLPALVNGVGDLSESGNGQLCAGLIKLRCVEKVNEFRAIVE